MAFTRLVTPKGHFLKDSPKRDQTWTDLDIRSGHHTFLTRRIPALPPLISILLLRSFTGPKRLIVPLDPQPPQPARPVSTYVDPADLVAATASKAKADDIKTWSITEIDKKGKKKKGTLGIGNGAIFFASESDKVCLELPHLSSSEPLELILNSLTTSSDSSSEMANISDHVLWPLSRQS